jgi:hypothetical protein
MTPAGLLLTPNGLFGFSFHRRVAGTAGAALTASRIPSGRPPLPFASYLLDLFFAFFFAVFFFFFAFAFFFATKQSPPFLAPTLTSQLYLIPHFYNFSKPGSGFF